MKAARNQEEHCYAKQEPVIDEVYPEYSRFFFRKSLGKTRTHTQEEIKKLSGEMDLKSAKQLENAKLFMEGQGFPEDAPGSGSNASIVNVKWESLCAALQSLKSA